MPKQNLNNPKRYGGQPLHEQHVEVSKSINRVLLVLIGFSLFCILTLGAEDASLLRTDATITMPFAGTQNSFVTFLIIGPTVLIALTVYLHVLVGYWNSLGGRQYKGALPQIQNIQTVGAMVVSGYLLYWLTPTVLAVFAWKALPRPEGPWLVAVGSFVAAILAWLQISRQKIHRAKWLKRIWILVPVVFATLFIVQGYYQAPFIITSYYQLRNLFHPSNLDFDIQYATPTPGGDHPITYVPPEFFPRRLFERRLLLRGADLSNQSIGHISIKNGDLSFGNLSKTLFSVTEFTNADIHGANLSGSRFAFVWLNGANLQGANLSGAQFVFVSLSHANLQGANLSGAQLSLSALNNANLRDADLSGANMRMSEGLTCEQLTQAKRWWETGRPPDLACGRKIPTKYANEPFLTPWRSRAMPNPPLDKPPPPSE